MNRNLNIETLNIIFAIQDYKSYLISHNILFNIQTDWYEKVKEYYDNIPDAIFNKSILVRNKHDLEKCIFFEITDDIMNCNLEEIQSFKF